MSTVRIWQVGKSRELWLRAVDTALHNLGPGMGFVFYYHLGRRRVTNINPHEFLRDLKEILGEGSEVVQRLIHDALSREMGLVASEDREDLMKVLELLRRAHSEKALLEA